MVYYLLIYFILAGRYHEKLPPLALATGAMKSATAGAILNPATPAEAILDPAVCQSYPQPR